MRLVALLCFLVACEAERARSDATPLDAGQTDTGVTDTGAADTGVADTGLTDTGAADTGVPDTGVTPTGICMGRSCLTEIGTQAQWAFVAAGARAPTRCDVRGEAHFFVSKAPGAPVDDPIFIDANAHRDVYSFVREEMSDLFPGMDAQAYFDQFERDDRATYWFGRIFEVGGAYGFSIDGTAYFMGPPNQTTIEAIHAQLAQKFTLPLGYAPQRQQAIREAEQFAGVAFELYLPEPCAGEGCSGTGPCLIIPEDTQACGHFAEGRDVLGEWRAKMRLELEPGSFELPTQVGSTSMKLFGGGAFGPDATPLIAPSDGTLEVTDFNGNLQYSFSQTVMAGSDMIELSWSVGDVILREPNLSGYLGIFGSINGGTNWPDDQVVIGACDPVGLSLYFIEGSSTDGVSFRLEYRHMLPFAGSGPLLLTGAQVSIGGQTAEVYDYSELAYAGEHHNWNNQFVVRFESPLTYAGHDVYGLWIDEAPYRCCPVDGIYTIDADGDQLDTLPVADYQRTPFFN